MLTFEFDQKEEVLCIHGDVDGLRSLIESIQQLLKNTKSGEFQHEHLLTRDWGGDQLTGQKLNATATLVNHVKLYCWKTSPFHA